MYIFYTNRYKTYKWATITPYYIGKIMARPRGFDENEVIMKAMMLFWERGYDTTSITELEKATGLPRVSIYNAFGDKEGLFLRALDLYKNNATMLFNKIAEGGLEDIANFFEWFARPFTSAAPNQGGCLMVNTILGLGQSETAIYEKVKEYRTMLQNTYVSALTNSQQRGEMEATESKIKNRAEFLIGVQWGAGAVVKLHHSTASAAPMNSVVCETIRMWKKK